MRQVFLCTVLLAAGLGGSCSAEETVPLAYVASAGNNHVRVIDLTTGRTLAKVYSGAAPWKLVHDPARNRLWIQHWYSATTAVLDLEQHQVVEVLPYRGPGILDRSGEHFLTFSWPGSALYTVDADSLETEGQRVTEINRAYALALDQAGGKLWMAQFDPMTEGRSERFAYLVSYPLDSDPTKAVPRSQRTGNSPVDIVPIGNQPFLITADRGTNGLSLINNLGDGRAVPACPAPQSVVVSPDESRMVVLCWDRGESRFSRMVGYRTDFTTRPWPTLIQEKDRRLQAGLTKGRFSPDGRSLYVLDETGGLLLDVDPVSLETRGEMPTGDVPRDLVIIATPRSARDRLAAGEIPSRDRLRETVARIQASGSRFQDLSWTETASWQVEPPPKQSEDEAPSDPESSEDDEPTTESRQLRLSLLAPDRLRSESEGLERLAQGGWTLAVGSQGRFWAAPRQELSWLVYSLPNFPLDEAVRQLAGDVPGSPFLRGGLAVDLVGAASEDPSRILIGALNEAQPLAYLEVDSQSGRPSKLVEQFPTFLVSGHGGDSFSGQGETRYDEWASFEGGAVMPRRLERLAGGRLQQVEISQVKRNSGLPEAPFDLSRLGGAQADRTLIDPVALKTGDQSEGTVPILPVPGYLDHPRSPHPPYNSSPPTSGPRLDSLAAWGVHTLPVPLELQVHNLEHGGVLIQYNCPQACPELVDRLKEFIQDRDQVLLAPYPYMDSRLALTAWGRLLRLEEIDLDRMQRFIEAYGGQDHHAGSP